jgi:hypothetical protein
METRIHYHVYQSTHIKLWIELKQNQFSRGSEEGILFLPTRKQVLKALIVGAFYGSSGLKLMLSIIHYLSWYVLTYMGIVYNQALRNKKNYKISILLFIYWRGKRPIWMPWNVKQQSVILILSSLLLYVKLWIQRAHCIVLLNDVIMNIRN